MNGNKKVFIDTNILIYAYSSDEIEKSLIVQKLFENQDEMVISTQVINEFINVMRKKRAIPIATLEKVIREIASMVDVSLITLETIERALKLSQNYKYSYFDSLMIASAIENSCMILYSEDMHHEQSVADVLTIFNPFYDLYSF